MSTAPPRRFAPSPVETTSRSSKQTATPPNDEAQASKPRRFLPEPVESVTRSSKDVARPITPETGSFKAIKQQHARRFAPQPVEVTKKSSRDKIEEKEKPKPRRFAPEPMETSHKSSKDKKPSDKAHIKFKPELVETSYSNSAERRKASDDSSPAKAARKFAPMLVATSSRTRKSGDSNVTSDKTEQGHGHAACEHRQLSTGVLTPMELDDAEPRQHVDVTAIADDALLRPISPFDGSSRRAKSQQRQHSFRCPDLATIESSESECESDASSTAPDAIQGSPVTASDSSFNEYKHATRVRESVDENFANYFLQLEQKRAEKRMREQALAAFPNSDFHEPVQHYMDVEKDSDSDLSIDYRPVTYDGEEEEEEEEEEQAAKPSRVHRDSTSVPWEQLELQRHAEALDEERKANQITAKQPSNGPWWKPEYDLAQPPDRELRSMRDRARPPMLGGDIEFTRCQSPEPARFDVTQGAAALKEQMAAEANRSQPSSPVGTLWTDPNKRVDSSSDSSDAGLWGGFCSHKSKPSAGGLAAPMMPTGLVTPRSESLNPFDQSFVLPHVSEMGGGLLQTPPTSDDSMSRGSHTINNILITTHDFEQSLATEYSDAFVTQVYNYLSLGYPSLARAFDDELSRISHVSIADLRRDDEMARQNPRGYIRLGADFEGGGGVESEESCMRWVALKRYVHEWARQEKQMSHGFDGPNGPGTNWTVAVRRGSWGN